jgi:hypothetical protein
MSVASNMGFKAVPRHLWYINGLLYLPLLKSYIINKPVSEYHIDNFTMLSTHSKRLNCGQGTMGFLHSACWFVRYSVIIESRVT